VGGPERWPAPHVPTAFGEDAFGRRAEAEGPLLRHSEYIAGQTMLVIAWIAVKSDAVGPPLGSLPIHSPQPRVLHTGGLQPPR